LISSEINQIKFINDFQVIQLGEAGKNLNARAVITCENGMANV